MSDRILNFGAGPGVLPEPVLQEAQRDLWSFGDTGIGILEHSHRGAAFGRVRDEAEADLRALLDLPDSYDVLFLHGGAATQFFMLPANFLADGETADYLCTGSWSKKAIAEAKHYGNVHVAASSQDDEFRSIPGPDAVRWSERPAYVHFTSNNTIFGTQWREEPEPPEGAFLACDASSDFLSRPVDVSRYGVIYAGAQKNLGTAGIALVIVRKDLLERQVRELPSMLRYRIHADNRSLYNTPPVFGVYVMGRVFAWIRSQGGLQDMARRAEERARIVYEAIDGSQSFHGTAREGSRSRMNVTFRGASEEVEARFLEAAAKRGMAGLKGHRSVGGMRASLYNAFPVAGCEALAQLIRDFEAGHA